MHNTCSILAIHRISHRPENLNSATSLADTESQSIRQSSGSPVEEEEERSEDPEGSLDENISQRIN